MVKLFRGMRLAAAVVSFLTPILLYNNCTGQKFSTNSSREQLSLSGNGDGYSGKTEIYSHYSAQNPCVEKALSGGPLPNAQIFRSANRLDLVRKACQDIPAQALNSADVSPQPNGSLQYQGRDYTPQYVGLFDVKTTKCPTGFVAKSQPVHASVLEAPLDMENTLIWDYKDSMNAALTSSFSGMPAFSITRTLDASTQNWLRISQYQLLQKNTYYALSFFARAASSRSIALNVYDSNPSIHHGYASWNLDTGVGQIDDQVAMTNVSLASEPVAGGYYLTFYFQTPDFTRGLDMGFAPVDLGLGASVIATGFQLEPIRNICDPVP
ncbi:MAG: hypothetical protein AB7F86_12760 [Bdellovibrionales bacterium]